MTQNRIMGTPREMGSVSEKQLPISVACRLSVRHEENQRNIVPYLSYQIDKHLMRMSLSMVSNATDRSTMVSAVTLPLSMLRLMSLWTLG